MSYSSAGLLSAPGQTLTPRPEIESILSCSNFDHVAECVLAPLVRRLDCQSACFMQLSIEQRTQRAVVGRTRFFGPINAAVAAYEHGAFRRDPLLLAESNQPHSMSKMESGPRVANRATGLPVLRAWRDFLAEMRMGDTAGITFPVETAIGRSFVALSFHRPSDAGSLGDADLSVLADSLPAVRAVMSNLILAEASALSNQVLGALVDAGAVGFALFDEALNCRYANDRGLSMIEASSVAQLADARAQGHACGIGAVSFGPDTHVVPLATASGERLYLALATRSGPTHYLNELRRQYGLTEREADVTRLIVQGHGNASAARQLGIALRTVENHLRAIYAKLGVGTRTQLVARAIDAR